MVGDPRLLTKTGVDNIVVQAGAASSNGVSLGSGSIKTLTPEDAEAILHECPTVDSLAPLVFTRRQVVYGNKNWVPSTSSAPRRDTCGCASGRTWRRASRSPTATSATSRWSACWARRSRASSSASESPVGQEVYVNDVPLRVLGVLSRKGADIIGEDQDDILRRPLDDGQVPDQRGGVAGRRGRGAGRTPADPLDPQRGAIPAATPQPSRPPSPTQTLGHAPAAAALERRLDPGPRGLDRRDPRRDGPDHPRPARAAPDRARRRRTTSPSATSPRSSSAVQGTVGLWPACSCASR